MKKPIKRWFCVSRILVAIHPKEIIESFSENILDYLQTSNEAQLFDGLEASIECSVSNIMTSSSGTANYRHDKKKKFE